MLSPNISVIMPAYNAAKTIREAIESVVNQSYKNWELIVIDDFSSDNSSEIVNEFIANDNRIKLVRLSKNGGLPNARNQGCLLAKGNFIAFLDSDDLWHKEKLQKQSLFHEENPSIEISHTNFISFDSNKFYYRPFRKFIDKNEKVRGNLYPSICYKNSIGVLTVMVKRDLLVKVNLFDTTLWTMEDQDLWIRIAKEKKAFGYLNDVLAYYRISEGGISKRLGKYKRAHKIFFKKILKENRLDKSSLFSRYYRHFGTAYLRRNEYKLSILYFLTSIKLGNFNWQNLSTCLYASYALCKWSLSSLTNRYR